MSPSSRHEIDAVFDALDADLDRASELSFDALTAQEQLALLERCERVRRRIPAVEHPLINSVARRPRQKSWAANCPTRSRSGR